jgi:UPF0755 protein
MQFLFLSQTNKTDTGARSLKNIYLSLTGIIFCLCCILAVVIFFVTTSPKIPQEGIKVEITRGMSMQAIAREAKMQGVVRSETFLYFVLAYAYDPTSMYAGVYSFTENVTVFEVAQKLASQDFNASLTRITIPEGATRKQIADIAASGIKDFDTNHFLEQTKNLEGYLFPDTYFVARDFTAEQLVTLLSETFIDKTATFAQHIKTKSLSEYDVLILASILEKEANDELSMKMVSGILQNRLEIKMALQVDATVGYVLDKPLIQLDPTDLSLDTPYNTYKNPGLPPTPIGNPGLQAIDAVLNPAQSEYLYYITGTDGNFYYAKTFEEHKQNIARYLK